MPKANKELKGNAPIVKRKRGIIYICCTPVQHCDGSEFKEGGVKFHGTPEAVHSCQERYLLKVEGYKKIGKRMYQREGEPILVLHKRPVRAKPGKETRYMAKVQRWRSW